MLCFLCVASDQLISTTASSSHTIWFGVENVSCLNFLSVIMHFPLCRFSFLEGGGKCGVKKGKNRMVGDDNDVCIIIMAKK